ncbi:MAG: hypothetical protein AUH85_11150 [Chloroflexi bacterium 13_1_40CM_4_68_4]|nr:MAG: hypothetical protein AUH85_11150 [Chloroflexi bacterium 13_1_40CM_4_68_4]
MSARWSYDTWQTELRLPFGASSIIATEATVQAGEVVARGTRYRGTRRVNAAKVLACPPEQVRDLLRVRVGESVRSGAIIARQGQRFARAIVAAEDGRIVHLDAEGGVHIATVRAEWEVRSPLDGVVRDADARAVVVEGASWAISGIAAFGPSRAGALTLAVDAADEELVASRLDVSAAGRVLVGGARVSGEALARAHAVGAAGVVVASASFRALLPVYGEDASAFGTPSDEDVPTLFILGAFGHAPFDRGLFDALRRLDGSRAAIDAENGRLHVFAQPDASRPLEAAALSLEDDLSGARLA